DAARSAVGAFSAVSASARGVQGAESDAPSIGPDDAAAVAREAYPGAVVVGVGLPAGPRGVYRISLREAADTRSRAGTMVFVDPRSRSVLQRAGLSTRTTGDDFLLWQRILHEGSGFGVPGRVVTSLAGLLPPLLVVTGCTMWLRSRRRAPRVEPAGT